MHALPAAPGLDALDLHTVFGDAGPTDLPGPRLALDRPLGVVVGAYLSERSGVQGADELGLGYRDAGHRAASIATS